MRLPCPVSGLVDEFGSGPNVRRGWILMERKTRLEIATLSLANGCHPMSGDLSLLTEDCKLVCSRTPWYHGVSPTSYKNWYKKIGFPTAV
jgi:hypothetical protein